LVHDPDAGQGFGLGLVRTNDVDSSQQVVRQGNRRGWIEHDADTSIGRNPDRGTDAFDRHFELCDEHAARSNGVGCRGHVSRCHTQVRAQSCKNLLLTRVGDLNDRRTRWRITIEVHVHRVHAFGGEAVEENAAPAVMSNAT
jgi:hypothetical protein